MALLIIFFLKTSYYGPGYFALYSQGFWLGITRAVTALGLYEFD